jgi:hypothetical protein
VPPGERATLGSWTVSRTPSSRNAAHLAVPGLDRGRARRSQAVSPASPFTSAATRRGDPVTDAGPLVIVGGGFGDDTEVGLVVREPDDVGLDPFFARRAEDHLGQRFGVGLRAGDRLSVQPARWLASAGRAPGLDSGHVVGPNE